MFTSMLSINKANFLYAFILCPYPTEIVGKYICCLDTFSRKTDYLYDDEAFGFIKCIINQSSMMEYDKNIQKYKISTIAISQWLMLM